MNNFFKVNDLLNILNKYKVIKLFDFIKNQAFIYIVGGFTRDFFSKKIINKDIDIVIFTKKNKAKIIQKIIKKFISFKNFIYYKKFFSISFIYNRFYFNINFARKEFYRNNKLIYKFHDVKLIDDIKRRDITINSIYFEIFSKKIIYKFDTFDVKKSFIKIINLNFFLKDVSRIFRILSLMCRGFYSTVFDNILLMKKMANIIVSDCNSYRSKYILQKYKNNLHFMFLLRFLLSYQDKYGIVILEQFWENIRKYNFLRSIFIKVSDYKKFQKLYYNVT